MQLFVDNLINVDFSYLHPTRGMLGETWIASTVMSGQLDQQGMICDFGVVKKTLRQWLDNEIDHRLVVPLQSKQLTLEETDDQYIIHWHYGDNTLVCRAPKSAIALVDTETITPQHASNWCCEQVRKLLPETLEDLELAFHCEAISGAYYHYSHGLKKHDGNCQRIAHGHRSTIEITRNHQKDTVLEEMWAERFRDIYIGTQEDITSAQDNTLSFAYTTAQGAFELSLPKQQCYLIDSDSTVELIAQHIANTLKQQWPDDYFRVKAFEGMGKGAIIEA